MRLKRNADSQWKASFHWTIFHLMDCFSFSYDALSSYLFHSILSAPLSIHLFLKKHKFSPIILPVNVLGGGGRASCLYSAYSLQPKTEKREAKQRPGPAGSSAYRDCLVLGSPQNIWETCWLSPRRQVTFIWITVSVKGELWESTYWRCAIE